MQVFRPGTPVRSVVLEALDRRAVAVTDNQVVSVPLVRCDVHATCAQCLDLGAAEDDGCGWNEADKVCKSADTIAIRDISTICPVVVAVEEKTTVATATTEVTASPPTTLFCPVCSCVCPIKPAKSTTTTTAATNVLSDRANFTLNGM